jgi:N-acetylglutamate synthase-like GNAT family acetyltransferase
MPTLVFREAVLADLPAVSRLYAQLNLADPPLARSVETAAFQQILSREGMHILLLERDGVVIGTTYLNLIPNLTRSASPYAVIENVVVEETLRGQGLGRQLMARTLDAAWAAGCYKAMLMTGSKRESTHAFYRACGFSPDEKQAYVAHASSWQHSNVPTPRDQTPRSPD